VGSAVEVIFLLTAGKQTCETQPWFSDYVKSLANIADKSKGRKYRPALDKAGGPLGLDLLEATLLPKASIVADKLFHSQATSPISIVSPSMDFEGGPVVAVVA
jgi:hypothetical protein